MGLKLIAFLSLMFLVMTCSSHVQAQDCKPSGGLRGKRPPPNKCNTENFFECCVQGKLYITFDCSLPVTKHTKAVLTLNSFQKGGDGDNPSECDLKYHDDNTPIVALSTSWFEGKGRYFHNITICGNGRSVKAMVVDECD